MNDQCSKCRFVTTAGENFYCHRNPPIAVRDGKNKHLGMFTTPEAAHAAYCAAALERFGEFAKFSNET